MVLRTVHEAFRARRLNPTCNPKTGPTVTNAALHTELHPDLSKIAPWLIWHICVIHFLPRKLPMGGRTIQPTHSQLTATIRPVQDNKHVYFVHPRPSSPP